MAEKSKKKTSNTKSKELKMKNSLRKYKRFYYLLFTQIEKDNNFVFTLFQMTKKSFKRITKYNDFSFQIRKSENNEIYLQLKSFIIPKLSLKFANFDQIIFTRKKLM